MADGVTNIAIGGEPTVQELLATPLKAAARPPGVVAANQHLPDQDIPLDKLKFDTDVDPRRVLSYMFNVTAYFRKCVRECACFILSCCP